MKSIFFLLIFAIVFNSIVFGQKVKPVPTAVRKSFSQKFPKIKRVIWDNSEVKFWEAEFRMQGNEYSVLFNLEGGWIKTEHEISTNEIPLTVKAAINKEFAGYKIKEAEISETQSGKVYEIELKKSGEGFGLFIDENGKVIKKEKGEIEKEDEGD